MNEFDEFEQFLKSKIDDDRIVSDEEFKKYIESHYYWGTRTYLSCKLWTIQITDFFKNTDLIRQDDFFIKAYGLLLEITNLINKKSKQAKKIQSSSDLEIFFSDQQSKIHFEYLELSKTTINKIRNRFSDEELITIAYIRNKYCHPYLTKYFVEIVSEGDKFFDFRKHENIMKIEKSDESLIFDSLKGKLITPENYVFLLELITQLNILSA